MPNVSLPKRSRFSRLKKGLACLTCLTYLTYLTSKVIANSNSFFYCLKLQ